MQITPILEIYVLEILVKTCSYYIIATQRQCLVFLNFNNMFKSQLNMTTPPVPSPSMSLPTATPNMKRAAAFKMSLKGFSSHVSWKIQKADLLQALVKGQFPLRIPCTSQNGQSASICIQMSRRRERDAMKVGSYTPAKRCSKLETRSQKMRAFASVLQKAKQRTNRKRFISEIWWQYKRYFAPYKAHKPFSYSDVSLRNCHTRDLWTSAFCGDKPPYFRWKLLNEASSALD